MEQLRMRTVPSRKQESMAVAMQTQDFPVLPSGLAEVNKMIKEHSDLFSDSHCKVCSAVLISESQKLTHYQSKKHANKVRRFLSVQGDKEPHAKKFKAPPSLDVAPPKNLLQLDSAGAPSPAVAAKGKDEPSVGVATGGGGGGGGAGNNNNNNNGNPDRFCSICQASFNNPLMAQQHYVGKKHRKQMTKLKLLETYGPSTVPASTLKGYPCAVCNIELNSVDQYQSHISGAKHKNQVKRVGLNSAKQQQQQQPSAEQQQPTPPPPPPPPQPDDQLAATPDPFMAGDLGNPFAGGDSEYSEEYQYT